MNELVVAAAIGVLAGSGVWLLLRPRTFQVAIGLTLLSYAVNIFIFAMGGLRSGAAPVVSAIKRFRNEFEDYVAGRRKPVMAA